MLVVGLILRLASPENVGEFNLHTTGTILIWVAAVLLFIQAMVFIIAWLFR
jgi:hypothetical protein